MTEHTDLAHEFPEMKDAIHLLKMNDAHFKKLFDQYEAVAKELHRAADGAGGISDEHAEALKKQRLALKDEMYQMLLAEAPAETKASGTCGKASCGCGS
jgi:uncharacterized protein YdcH (DUF465 family)